MRSSSVLAALLAATGCSPLSPLVAPLPGVAPDAGAPEAHRAREPVALLFIGSGGFGFGAGSAFPGATAPHGMVKVGPDTSGAWGTVSFLHFSGYWYGDDTVRGFSHMHLHGTGAQDYGLLGLMPTDQMDASRTTAEGYQSTFAKSSEKAEPGFFGLTLDRGGIAVELTATPHGAHHRYSYPASAKAGHVIFDLDRSLGGKITDAVVDVVPQERAIRGHFRNIGPMSGGFGGFVVYFEIGVNRDFTGPSVWSAASPFAPGAHAEGTGVGASIDVDVSDGKPIEVRVGLSLVSASGAAVNLAAEMPAFAFEQTRAAAASAWSAATGALTVQGGTADEQSMFAGALYHLFLMPTVFSDVDGSYVGLDGKVASAAGTHHYVSDMSLWDTYRTLHPLYSLIAQDRARDAVMSLVDMGKSAGYFPKWPIATGESGSMIGASAEVVLADAYLKGNQDFDAEGAYAVLRAAAMDPVAPKAGRGGRDDVEPYMALGYVPAARGRSVSKTVEYGQDDFALGQLAGALGHAADASKLAARARGWAKLFDPASGFLWAKDDKGAWASSHVDPTNFQEDFVEANAWQTVWGPLWDSEGLIAAFGGKEKLVTALESFFERGKADYESIHWDKPLSAGALRKWYWGGNEPDMHAPYLFALAGRRDLMEKWVRWIMAEVYGPGADGLPGNDDGGTMSAWYVWSAIGLYPIAGSDRYILGVPVFPHVELGIDGGTFTIEALGVSDTSFAVQSVKLDGVALTTPTLRHADVKAGGKLEFVIGN